MHIPIQPFDTPAQFHFIGGIIPIVTGLPAVAPDFRCSLAVDRAYLYKCCSVMQKDAPPGDERERAAACSCIYTNTGFDPLSAKLR
jgi:hypothetical protein